MIRSFRLQGIVIKRRDYSEYDKFITLFTKTRGKITVLARGIRRLQSRKSAHLELFNVVEVQLAKARSFDIVTETASVEMFPLIRQDIVRVAYAYKLAEEIDRLFPEHEEHFKIYSYICETFRRLASTPVPALATVADECTLYLLQELGFIPKTTDISGHLLKHALESTIERTLKTDSLLTKVAPKI